MRLQIDVKKLREVFCYDPETGVLTNRVSRKGGGKKGAISGCSRHDGYLIVRVENKLLLGHRVIWALHYGQWPDCDIDHVNQDKSDNRITNLRLSNKSNNSLNRGRRADNKSGVKNVSWNKPCGKWDVRMKVNGIQKCFGLFDSLDEAREVATKGRMEMHGEFVCHG
jgi:hypothetical protein